MTKPEDRRRDGPGDDRQKGHHREDDAPLVASADEAVEEREVEQVESAAARRPDAADAHDGE